MKRKKYFIIGVTGLATFLILTLIANWKITKNAQGFIFSDIEQLKPVKTGLLLGTSKLLNNGTKNDFFYHRIEATVALLKNQKIKYVIVSGDNSRADYNEPLDMKKALMDQGIPDSVIFLDYAGFRTFDSVIRAKEVFSQDSFIVISQKFHNERAVYIARQNQITAFGYNAQEVEAYKGFKTKLREFFARDKVFLDNLFGTTPKYLGEKIKIE